MSSVQVPLNKIIIGTASWGSKISYNDAHHIANELTNSGFNQFDTAQNYGSGYSQDIINKILKNKKIKVNTKFGQKIQLSFRELFKRIYRFNNFNAFLKSNLNLINYSFQNEEKFWLISNIDKNLIKIKKDLNNCLIDTFFLHSPHGNILSQDFLVKFEKFCFFNNLKPGISNIDDKSLKNLINKKYKNFTFQLPLLQYFKFEKKILENKNIIHLNSIFNSKFEQKKIKKNNYSQEVFKYFSQLKNVKLIFGINSITSAKKLINNLSFPNSKKI